MSIHSRLFLLTMGLVLLLGPEVSSESPHGVASESTNETIYLNDPELTESSGLAASLHTQGHFWTHNDSGDKARLFAFDVVGNKTGGCEIQGVQANDIEDMSVYRLENQSRLVVADTGDNLAKRTNVTLFFFDEPDPTKHTTIRDFGTLDVTYPDGPQDCEAIAVDAQRNGVLLVTKSKLGIANVYFIDLSIAQAGFPWQKKVTATFVCNLSIPMVTGIDIDPNNGDAWVVNYFLGFCFPSVKNSSKKRKPSIQKQFAAIPTSLELSQLRQVEAICVDGEGRIWITSEGSPAVLSEVQREPAR
ncbi:hypothetical protein Q31b_49040 [Novipirellula aureliae]|uniref:SMP-30/Gluconolaconase/LRE-like region n=1 Tax=Novipirellula aureliae TaxID=2527966 RepID=A0A5C6DH34_9BACT|nr:hypothetical protein [Novipirellula aureliae]TWU36623.1 hypothetical protein Q31b_49040 [Novipirellula aureliae]